MDFRPLDGAPYHGHIKTKFTDFNTASRHLVLEYTFISRSYTIRLILLLLLPHFDRKIWLNWTFESFCCKWICLDKNIHWIKTSSHLFIISYFINKKWAKYSSNQSYKLSYRERYCDTWVRCKSQYVCAIHNKLLFPTFISLKMSPLSDYYKHDIVFKFLK